MLEDLRDKLIQQIENAFTNVPYPGDDNITNADHCLECQEIAEAFQGKHWKGLPAKFLRYHSAALSLFKPKAFHYYLPAFMIAEVLDPETADVIYEGLILHLGPPEGTAYKEYHEGRILGYDTDQTLAILAYFKYLLARQQASLESYPALEGWRDTDLENDFEYWTQRSNTLNNS